MTYARYDWARAGSIYGPSGKARLRVSKSPVRNLVVAGGGNVGAGVEAVVVSRQCGRCARARHPVAAAGTGRWKDRRTGEARPRGGVKRFDSKGNR